MQYHLGKANIVADALSRKMEGNLAILVTSQKRLLEDMRRLVLEVVTSQVTARMVNLRLQSTMIETIKAAQLNETRILEIVDFYVDEEGMLRYNGRLCVPDQENLKKELLKEAHYSSYSIQATRCIMI